MQEESIGVKLPSRYAPYSVKSIKVKPLTNADIKVLINAEQDSTSNAVVDVFRRRIEGISLEELTVGDFWYVMYWIRYNTFIDQPMPVPWVCPEHACSTKNISSLTEGDLTTIELPESFVEPFVVVLPQERGELLVRLPRFGDDAAADEYLLKKKKESDALKRIDRESYHIDAGDKVFVMTALTLEHTINPTTGQIMPLDERVKFVMEYLTPNDLYILGQEVKKYNHGVQNVATFKCAGCGKEQKVRFRLSMQAFFLADDE